MDMNEARKEARRAGRQGDAQDFFMFSRRSLVRSSTTRATRCSPSPSPSLGNGSGAPAEGRARTEIEAKADGSMFKLIRYPVAGYWVSYSKTPVRIRSSS